MLRLICKGASIAVHDDGWRCPIHEAAGSGLPASVLILLQARNDHDEVFDINGQDIQGDTPLHVAASAWTKQVKKVMEALLEADSNVNLVNKLGRTALHIVSARSNEGEDDVNLVRLLRSYGAKIDVKDINGETPLHLAARNGNKNIMNELVRGGSQVSSINKDGLTPLDLGQPLDVEDMLSNIQVEPHWLPNTDSVACQACREPFTVTLRRHHVRNFYFSPSASITITDCIRNDIYIVSSLWQSCLY